MADKKTEQEIINLIKEVHGDVVKMIRYGGNMTTVSSDFEDIDFGSFSNTVGNVIHKQSGHRARGLIKISEKKKLPFAEVERKIKAINPHLKVVESTYKSSRRPCLVFDDRVPGIEWWPEPENIIYKSYGHPALSEIKKQQTCFMNFGVNYPTQSREIAIKGARTRNTIIDTIHWKTGKLVACQSYYELSVIRYFNDRNIDFHWEPKTFHIPEQCDDNSIAGRTYTPDCYLPERNIWIEVKGWLERNIISKNKWLWFHKEYPNSELWTKEVLYSEGITILRARDYKEKHV